MSLTFAFNKKTVLNYVNSQALYKCRYREILPCIIW